MASGFTPPSQAPSAIISAIYHGPRITALLESWTDLEDEVEVLDGSPIEGTNPIVKWKLKDVKLKFLTPSSEKATKSLAWLC